MTKIEITDKIVLVEVHDDDSDFYLSEQTLWYKHEARLFSSWTCKKDLPPHPAYSWAKKPGEISEEEAKQIMCGMELNGVKRAATFKGLLKNLIRSTGFNPDNCIVVKINEKG